MRITPKIILLILLSSGWLLTGFTNLSDDNRILGVWQSADNDLRVEMYARNGQYHGRLVWFLCESDDPPMADQLDTENPDPVLRSRPWLGMNIVESLTYRGHDEWSGGKVYDPNSGHTFEAAVWLTAPNQLSVRGYWKLPLLGRNMAFRRVGSSAGPTPERIVKK